ncbi:MAG: type VI secretion system tube protein Hcp [Actinobacteria bacterium]|nr:type VI secretion system tube protein Hcp [Actinomycetota bacterium]
MSAVDYFLKLDGIEGDSTDARHSGELVLDSFGWGLSQTGGPPGRGAGAASGKPQFQDLVFVQKTGRASPRLFLACATGQRLKSAVLTARRAGKTPFEFLTLTLGDVVVSSFQESGGAGEPPLETVSLASARLEISYRQQSATGKPEPELRAGFDLTLNKPV